MLVSYSKWQKLAFFIQSRQSYHVISTFSANFQRMIWFVLGLLAPSFGSMLALRLKKYFLGNKTFLFFKIECWNFQHLFKIKFRQTSQNFKSYSLFRQLLFSFFLSVVWMSWNFVRFHKILFQRDSESFSFLSWKTKKFYPWFFFWIIVNIKTKKALFTDPIFREGFAAKLANLKKCQLQASCRIDMATTFSKQWFLFLASMKAKNLSKKKDFLRHFLTRVSTFFRNCILARQKVISSK